jgi:DNA-directed RNA polymerase specialized sigma24 family protein
MAPTSIDSNFMELPGSPTTIERMSSKSDDVARLPAAKNRFATTRWSMVVAAGRKASPGTDQALAELCQAYWYPLYSYVRHQGYSAHDAQDLTQAFFARLLEKNFLAGVNRELERFRAFLLAALKHFVSNERDRERAKKRGGGRSVICWDAHDAESRYRMEPATELTAERMFDRQWAVSVLDRTLVRLEKDYLRSGKSALFEALKATLTEERGAVPYKTLADLLQMTEGAVKVAVHRLRQRYRTHLQAEIAHTVTEPAEVEAELRDLMAALG